MGICWTDSGHSCSLDDSPRHSLRHRQGGTPWTLLAVGGAGADPRSAWIPESVACVRDLPGPHSTRSRTLFSSLGWEHSKKPRPRSYLSRTKATENTKFCNRMGKVTEHAGAARGLLGKRKERRRYTPAAGPSAPAHHSAPSGRPGVPSFCGGLVKISRSWEKQPTVFPDVIKLTRFPRVCGFPGAQDFQC